MTIDITPLRNAIARLEEGLARYERDVADTQIRDGLIQRFEFTYELEHRMLRRYLASAAATPDDITQLAFADLIRTGNRHGLLRGEWPDWRRYREMRSKACLCEHDEDAPEVVRGIPAFLDEIRFLRDRLLTRTG
jgi:nucleotidyltransferase substrate binding protein (TIGR01987 family)